MLNIVLFIACLMCSTINKPLPILHTEQNFYSYQVVVDVGDVNDNNPLFEFNTFSVTYSIREDISRNTTIATIGATDADIFPNNRIVFDILSDPSENTDNTIHRHSYAKLFMHATGTLFKIDHETGLLQTEAGPGPDGFDYELFTQYSIVVIVSQHRQPITMAIL